MSVRAPTVVSVRLQLGAATAALQESTPSLTVTVPVGVPPPPPVGETDQVTLIGTPREEGFGAWEPNVVDVVDWLTVCAAPAEALPAKLPSPA